MQVGVHVEAAHERRDRESPIGGRSHAGHHQPHGAAAGEARELPICDVRHDEDPEGVSARMKGLCRRA